MKHYETVIGIETHVQLSTKSKLFCGCNNDSREAKPNMHVCPVCIALPGALPVLNKRAVELALKAGLALHAYNGIDGFNTKFDRKNYFYPDSPSGYQITQFDKPIIGKGYVTFPVDGGEKTVGITRAHLEADAGKLTHPDGVDYSLVDLNRAGTPLLEIISEPELHSAGEAKSYAQELYHLMRFAGVSDADLYYGNMRFDVNVSLRPSGQSELGTRTETKNLNSFRAVFNAVEFEIKRQAELLEGGQKVVQETRGWDENKQQTFSQRSKEEAHDYRYFPEPDLPPVKVTSDMLQAAKAEMPEQMPSDVRRELTALGVQPKNIEFLIEEYSLADRIFEAKEHVDEKSLMHVVNWLSNQWKDEYRGKTPDAKRLSQLVKMVENGEVSSTNAKNIFVLMHEDSRDPNSIANDHGFQQVSDTDALEMIVEEVIQENPGPVEQYKNGDHKVLGFLVGQVMKKSQGQANPPMVNEILVERLTR